MIWPSCLRTKSRRFMSRIPATKNRVVIKIRKNIMKPFPPKQMKSKIDSPNIVYPTIALKKAVENTKVRVSRKIPASAIFGKLCVLLYSLIKNSRTTCPSK